MSGEREKEDDIVTRGKRKEEQRNSKEKYARADFFLKKLFFPGGFFWWGNLSVVASAFRFFDVPVSSSLSIDASHPPPHFRKQKSYLRQLYSYEEN